jgi:outer membrane protein
MSKYFTYLFQKNIKHRLKEQIIRYICKVAYILNCCGKHIYSNTMRRILVLLLLFTPFVSNLAQEEWSLQDCLEYAVENNISLKRQEVLSEIYRTDLRASKANMLPNLNFSARANMNFGRSVDPVTNDITFSQNLGNSFSIGSGLTVFNGFALINRVSAARFMYQMGVELQKQQENMMALDIISAYYQLLMARGVVQTATRQLEVSDQQLHRVDVMVRTGSENKTTLLEMQSQVSNDRLLLTQAVNNEAIGRENLRRLLQLDPGVDFFIADKEGPVSMEGNAYSNADSVYNVANEIMAGITALEYQALAREKELKASIGEATPELRLSAGWGTGYFDAMTEGVETTPFMEQLKNNNSQSIEATLSIPIFNRWFYGRNIKRAKLSLQDSKLELEQGRNDLYQQVNTACLELAAISDEYLAALDNYKFSELAFVAVEKKFQIGMANATEYSEARRQKFSSEIYLLRTELQYEVKQMTIRFFLTGEWNS